MTPDSTYTFITRPSALCLAVASRAGTIHSRTSVSAERALFWALGTQWQRDLDSSEERSISRERVRRRRGKWDERAEPAGTGEGGLHGELGGPRLIPGETGGPFRALRAAMWLLTKRQDRSGGCSARSDGGHQKFGFVCVTLVMSVKDGVRARSISVGAIRMQMGFKVMGGGVAVNLSGPG